MAGNYAARRNLIIPWLVHELLKAPAIPARDISRLGLERVKSKENVSSGVGDMRQIDAFLFMFQ